MIDGVYSFFTRCDGNYILHIENDRSPTQQWPNIGPCHTGFGNISGLNGDQISYVAQASRKVAITPVGIPDSEVSVTVYADILPSNYNHTEEKLYLGFTGNQFRALANRKPTSEGLRVTVQFELKYQYFDRLRDSVKKVPQNILPRIVPDGTQPEKESIFVELDQYKKYLCLDLCSKDQLEALNATTSCSAGEPPLIITGPFGSGKTCVLALAAHISFKSPNVRLLVCTQQHVSADAFLSCFNDLTPVRIADVSIVLVVSEKSYRHVHQQGFAKTVDQLAQLSRSGGLDKKSKVMVVTTCSTANTLLYKKVFPPGYFTHIYIDEGAQMREPEAVAPLGFAKMETTIIIAGDQHQVINV